MRLIKEETDHDPDKYRGQTIELENLALKPFDQWTDFTSNNGEAIITFQTMNEKLYSEWSHQAQHVGGGMDHAEIGKRPTREGETVVIYEHRNFENNFDGPGIYLDSINYEDEDKFDECYTIIVPYEFMTREMVENYLQSLNEKYDRDFKLDDTDYTKRRINHVSNQITEDEDNNDIIGKTIGEEISLEEVIEIVDKHNL